MSDAGAAAGTTAGTTAGAAAAGALTLAADPFFASLDAETRGAFANHGWDQKSPAEAAANAMKSYRELERFTGVPKDQIARIPKDAGDAEGWKNLHARLGVPADPKEYDFSAVKFTDGTALDDDFVAAIGPSLQRNGVPKDRAAGIVSDIVKFMESTEQADTASTQATMAREAQELQKSWGPNMQANTFIANQAAEKLGLGKDVLATLSDTVGRVATAQALLKIGQMMGEDKFVASPNNGTGVMTREQAKAKLADLQKDQLWAQKLMKGDTGAMDQFKHLTTMIGPE